MAVSERGVAIHEFTWRAERNHSVELAPAVRKVMERAGIAPADLSAVFVARGPGGFSALRVGMALAKTLAMGLKVPLVSAGTFDVEMAPHLPSDLPLCALVPAGGVRLYAAWSDRPTGDLTVLTAEELAERTVEPTVFCGEAAAALKPMLTERLGEMARFRDGEPPTRSAATLARLAFARLEAGESDDLDTLEPLYMRSAQAQYGSGSGTGSRLG